jgi:hypothetical protein
VHEEPDKQGVVRGDDSALGGRENPRHDPPTMIPGMPMGVIMLRCKT